jgi:hypothetical protein
MILASMGKKQAGAVGRQRGYVMQIVIIEDTLKNNKGCHV